MLIYVLVTADPMKKDLLKRVAGVSTKKRYDPELRQFALTLHFISPRAYAYVRDSFETCLPNPRTLSRWYQSVDGEPGFSKESLHAIKLLTLKSPNAQLYGALCFDEMAIRRGIEFDGQNYVGQVSFGDIEQNSLLPEAKEVLVFMLTCVNGSWKIPIGYFLIDGLKADQKASLVKQALDLIEPSGVRVVSLTFDGCPANFAMCKVLGCTLDKGNINSVFVHNEKKVAIFPDPSHMLKLIRNTFGDKKELMDGNYKKINWGFIKKLVDLQENEEMHMANKLKRAHLFFRKQIMKVKLAAQTFSNSVADAIEFCTDDLELKDFENSKATTTFIRNINNIFDILNSRSLLARGHKKPVTEKNFGEKLFFLQQMYDYIASINIDGINIIDSQRKAGFLGFLVCIKSLIFLYQEFVKGNKDFKFLCTYKLSQDHLEYFFSSIRAKGGFNNNPSARQFKSAFKKLLVHGELKHITSGNCIPLTDIPILTYTKPEILINLSTDRHSLLNDIERDNTSQQHLDYNVIDNDHDYLADPSRLTEFAKSVITYIAGFVVRSVAKTVKCQHCLSVLRQDKFKSLQAKKDKGGLVYPSGDVIKICEIAEKIFRRNKFIKNPLHHLVQKCLKECLSLNFFNTIAEHFNEQSFINNHYGLLIKIICLCYFKTRIHYATKNLNKNENIRNIYTKLILFKGQ